MTSNVGQKYVCFVPTEKVDRLVGAGVPNITEVLLPLSGTCLRKVGSPRGVLQLMRVLAFRLRDGGPTSTVMESPSSSYTWKVCLLC